MRLPDAFHDRQLYGSHPAFSANPDHWAPWLAFLQAVYGLPLDAEGEALFRRRTGLETYAPPPGGWPELALVVLPADREAQGCHA